MKSKSTLRALAVLLCAGSVLSAQTEPKKPAPAQEPKKPAPAQEAPKPAAKEASAIAEPAVTIKFDVKGLSKDNEAKVKDALGGLTTTHYVCDACKVDQMTAGKCPKCSGDLAAKQKQVIQSTVAAADQGNVSVTIAPGSSIAYSQIDAALQKNMVSIDATKFPIAGKAMLVVKGGTADKAATIEKALKDAKLFDDVKASFDSAKSEIHVMVRAGAMAPTRAKVDDAVAATQLKVSDVVLGTPPKA